MVRITLLATLSFLLLSGCTKSGQSNEAIRQAIVNHLSKRADLSMAQMDVTVSNVTFKDNEAEATVGFKPKGGAENSGMQMHYTLERKGSEWVVKSKADSSGMPHGSMAPGAAPAMPPASTELPPDHPGLGGAAPKK